MNEQQRLHKHFLMMVSYPFCGAYYPLLFLFGCSFGYVYFFPSVMKKVTFVPKLCVCVCLTDVCCLLYTYFLVKVFTYSIQFILE